MAVALAATGLTSILQAGTLTTSFDPDPGGAILGKAIIEDGILKLVRLQDLDEGGRLPLHGSYILPDIDGGQPVASFNATFKARVGGGTEQPAQGFSFVFASDIVGFAGPFRESGGGSTGLVISFDTIDNLAGFEAEGNDPGDAPGVIIRFGGAKVAAKKFAGIRTDPANASSVTFVPVHVQLDADGSLTVEYNGNKIFDKYPLGYTPIAGQFGFGAGTAELTAALRDNHWIDDLNITTTVASGALVTKALPLAQGARPDAIVEIDIENLGAGATTLKFDGQAVTPTKTTGGTTTHLTYDPPGSLAIGSTHTVALTYGAKSLNYAFTVLNATVIPAAFAAPAGAVDTAASGFTIAVHQLEAAPSGGNTYQRAVDQLAGKLGPNIADLSGATAGLFTRPLINFEQDAGDGGDINSQTGVPDDYIPGIPGTTGSTDNIAMEMTGFLDLAAGTYTLGVVSDDNVRVSIGPDGRDATAAQLIDITIGRATSTFVVEQAGIYPVRLVWAEGGGGANVEFWYQKADGTKILVNDRSVAGAVKSYAKYKNTYKVPPHLSSAKPAPGEANVSTDAKIQLALTDGQTTVNASSIKVSVNGTQLDTAGGITKNGAVTSIALNAPVMDPKKDQTVVVEWADSDARSFSRQYVFTTGKGRSGGLTVKGQWDFDSHSLKATVGRDLHFIDDGLAARYEYVTTDGVNLPHIQGKPVSAIHVPYTATDEADGKGALFKRIGLRMNHNITPNGGGNKVNQWTLIMDVLWGVNGPANFGSVLQTHDFDNPTDGDMFWRASDGSYGKGCCSLYDGISQEAGKNHKRSEWARVIFSVDLSSTPRRFAKYINGNLHRSDLTGDGNALDSRFGLPPEVFLFGDGDDNERTDCFVNAIQIREGAITDEEAAALGEPSASGIPGPYSQWDFDKGNLAATSGPDLHLIDDNLIGKYAFGTTASFGIPDIDGKPAGVIHIPYTATDEADGKGPIFKRIGLRTQHGLGANGGGAKLNQWTLVMDVYWGTEGPANFGSVLQTHDFDNPTDGDMFWRASDGSYGKGCCSLYDGISQEAGKNHKRGEWARVVYAVDLTSTPRRFAKYVNGNLHRSDIIGDGNALDSRFALPPEFFLFGDGDDNERTDCFVNSIQLRPVAMTDEEVAALGGPSAVGIPTPNPVKGHWEFAGNLKALVGSDLEYIDSSLSGKYAFGTSDTFGIPGVGGKPVNVLHVPYTPTDEADGKGAIFKRIGLKATHGVPPNGGGAKANQWTLIMDVYWGTEGPANFGSLLQTHDFDNPTDGDMFWRASDGSYGKGCCSLYDGISQEPGKNQKRGEWARVIFSADLSASPRRLAKYVNGNLHRADLSGDGNSLDGRYGLPPFVYLFGDGDDNERTDCFVSAIQFREGAISDEDAAALGGVSPFGIPAAPAAVASKAAVAPTQLFSSATVNGTYAADASATVTTATKTIKVPLGTGTKFFRVSSGTATTIKSVSVVGGEIVITYQ